MDIWVVAAVAGAGYIASHRQNILRNRDSLSSELSRGGSDLERPESPLSCHQLHNESCPFHMLAQRKKQRGDVSPERERLSDTNFPKMSHLNGASVSISTLQPTEVSCNGGENLKVVEEDNEDCNALSLLSVQPDFLRSEKLLKNGDGCMVSDDLGKKDLFPKPSIWEMGSSHGYSRKRNSLSYKGSGRHFVKPLNSLESCFMAQLYKERAELEQYVLTSLLSPSAPTMWPSFVTNGTQINSSTSCDCAQIEMKERKLNKKPYSKQKASVLGLPLLPKLGAAELPGKIKHKRGRGQHERLVKSNEVNKGEHFHSQGSTDGSLLFCLGLSVGIISAVIANKPEVVKLKELLKQTEDLVQDLEDELEMKGTLTVKELADENSELQDTRDHSFNNRVPIEFLPENTLNKSITYDDDGIEPYPSNATENSESISKIEAELEAELERLELSMNSSSFNTRLSDPVELDTDFEADFAQCVGGQSDSPQDLDRDTSDTYTTLSAKCAVSPQELSLRLHEVIQSRLEKRVNELETALQNSQRKVRLMESERVNSWKEFSNSKLESSSPTNATTNAVEECNAMTHPLVTNLSEGTSAAFNEAYEELLKVNESQEKYSTYDGNYNFMAHCTLDKENTSNPCTNMEEHVSKVSESTYDVDGISGDGNSDSDDEMEELLIKQIVEKTKKRSPVSLNAQRLLLSMDEDEY